MVTEAAIKSAAWRKAHPIEMNVHRTRYRETHRDELRDSSRAYYLANKSLISERARERKYGVNPSMFQKMLEAQSYQCAMCGKELPEDHTFIAVDHSHGSGHVRGLLHRGCNVAVAAYENYRSQIEGYLKVYGEN